MLVNTTSTNQNISKIVVKASSPSDAYDNHLYLEGNETSGAADTGGVLGFGGHDGGSSLRNWANILGMKENASSGNTASYMAFHTRANGGNPTEKLRITSTGAVTISGNRNQVAPTAYDDLTGTNQAGLIIGSSGITDAGIMLRTGATGTGRIYFGDNSGSDAGRKSGRIEYTHNGDDMMFSTVWIRESSHHRYG